MKSQLQDRRIESRQTRTREDEGSPVGPVVLAFLVFVVISSAIFEIFKLNELAMETYM
jgi:hypothetical protein